MCVACMNLFDTEVYHQNKVAKANKHKLSSKEMDLWRFMNGRFPLERHLFLCESCEERKLNNKFNFENKLDNIRAIFLIGLEDKDDEVMRLYEGWHKDSNIGDLSDSLYQKIVNIVGLDVSSITPYIRGALDEIGESYGI